MSFEKGAKCKQTDWFSDDGNTDNFYCGTFMGCRALREVIFPDEFKWLASHTFAYCNSLKKISLGKEFSGIRTLKKGKMKCSSKTFFVLSGDTDGYIFNNDTKVKLSKKNKKFKLINNVIYSYDKKRLICYLKCKKSKTFRIPSKVRYLSKGGTFK